MWQNNAKKDWSHTFRRHYFCSKYFSTQSLGCGRQVKLLDHRGSRMTVYLGRWTLASERDPGHIKASRQGDLLEKATVVDQVELTGTCFIWLAGKK